MSRSEGLFHDPPARGSPGVRPPLAPRRRTGPIAAALGLVSLSPRQPQFPSITHADADIPRVAGPAPALVRPRTDTRIATEPPAPVSETSAREPLARSARSRADVSRRGSPISSLDRALWCNTDFRRFFAGQFVTNAGDSLYTVAMLWLAFELSNSTLVTGALNAILLLP